MRVSGNTILITGGTSGIGFEFAAQLLKLGNTVTITGRDQSRLEEAQRKLPGILTFQSDVSDPKAIPVLFEAVIKKFPALNVLINNAGIMRKINFQGTGNDTANGLEDISREIETNLIGPVRMAKQLLPHLKTQKVAAIVNVSSGLAFVPFPIARSIALPKQVCIPSRNLCVCNSRTPGLRYLSWLPRQLRRRCGWCGG